MSFRSESSTGRGGRAPRSGRGGWSRPFIKRQEPVRPDIVKNPLGDLVALVGRSDLTTSTAGLPGSSSINDCQYVASYNWLASKDTTILVPGQPPLWLPPKKARQLPEDSGSFFRDPNAARYPEYPVAPAVQAIMTVVSDTLTRKDVFACGSTLGNLLRFVRGGDRPFRFSVEVIGNTVFLVRKENDPKELIEGVRGFGHSFPDAYTTWPEAVKGSETHQRIVQYDLGGIQCLVRFECDGFFDDKSKASVSQLPRSPLLDTDTLAQVLSTSSVSVQTLSSTGPLSIEKAGNMIPQACIFDLKTRSGKHGMSIKMDDITPQLWLKQIPNFVVAYHDGFGLFTDIEVQDARGLISAFEGDNAEAIRQLVVLLNKIISIARANDEELLEVYFPGQDMLEIRRQVGTGAPALPEELKKQWIARCELVGSKLKNMDAFMEAGSGDGSPDDFTDSPEDWGEENNFTDSSEERDFTACSAEDCGYCGRCTY